ncbi:MAG: ABC transporter ATP-binding protein [Tepidanaerobacteraceae bacterium]|nr:ABC transporter ATP-binding protein [Tepidanaerobacteraceae bacterium]
MSYLEANDLWLKLGQNEILRGVSMSVEKGEVISILGPSGCGKSTLLRTIAGLLEPQRGTICIDGRDITRVEPQFRNIGMVFQSYALFPNMNVFDNIGFGLRMRGMDKDMRNNRIREMLELVKLKERASHYPHQLSGGEQQRAALARTLAPSPKIVLLDEPLSALDAKIRKALRQELRSILKCAGATAIFVTHDQEEAMFISDRIFVMNMGRFEQKGSAEEIYSSPQNRFVASFIGNYNLLSGEEASFFAEDIPGGRDYALRPEAISLFSLDHLNVLKGTDKNLIHSEGIIENSHISGSIVHYLVKAGPVNLAVDALYREDGAKYSRGERVLICFSRDALKGIERN